MPDPEWFCIGFRFYLGCKHCCWNGNGFSGARSSMLRLNLHQLVAPVQFSTHDQLWWCVVSIQSPYNISIKITRPCPGAPVARLWSPAGHWALHWHHNFIFNWEAVINSWSERGGGNNLALILFNKATKALYNMRALGPVLYLHLSAAIRAASVNPQ